MERWRTTSKKVLEALKNYHPTIKFKHTMDKNEIVFLDTIVYKSPTNRIWTRIYQKSTDQKHDMHYHSAHPRNQQESVPYGLLIRGRICTEDQHFEEKAKKYTTNLNIGNIQLIF